MKTIMYKILFLVASIVAFVGCEPDPGMGDHKLTIQSGSWWNIHEITVDGKTHEYITYDRGICHYPECKYCKRETK